MGRREAIVHIPKQTYRYLKECVRLGALVTGRLRGMQYNTDFAIRHYFRQLVRKLQTEELAPLVDAQLVRDAGLELESRPPVQPKAEKEEKTRKEPQTGTFDIT